MERYLIATYSTKPAGELSAGAKQYSFGQVAVFEFVGTVSSPDGNPSSELQDALAEIETLHIPRRKPWLIICPAADLSLVFLCAQKIGIAFERQLTRHEAAADIFNIESTLRRALFPLDVRMSGEIEIVINKMMPSKERKAGNEGEKGNTWRESSTRASRSMKMLLLSIIIALPLFFFCFARGDDLVLALSRWPGDLPGLLLTSERVWSAASLTHAERPIIQIIDDDEERLKRYLGGDVDVVSIAYDRAVSLILEEIEMTGEASHAILIITAASAGADGVVSPVRSRPVDLIDVASIAGRDGTISYEFTLSLLEDLPGYQSETVVENLLSRKFKSTNIATIHSLVDKTPVALGDPYLYMMSRKSAESYFKIASTLRMPEEFCRCLMVRRSLIESKPDILGELLQSWFVNAAYYYNRTAEFIEESNNHVFTDAEIGTADIDLMMLNVTVFGYADNYSVLNNDRSMRCVSRVKMRLPSWIRKSDTLSPFLLPSKESIGDLERRGSISELAYAKDSRVRLWEARRSEALGLLDGCKLLDVEPGRVEPRDTELHKINKLMASYFVALEEYPEMNIVVTGNADKSGASGDNEVLGVERAQFICKWLENNGVSPDRIKCRSMGDRRRELRQETSDRRTEICLSPSD